MKLQLTSKEILNKTFTKDVKNYDILKLNRPSFASMWVCNDLFKKDILKPYLQNLFL